jgi:hypothetical protein
MLRRERVEFEPRSGERGAALEDSHRISACAVGEVERRNAGASFHGSWQSASVLAGPHLAATEFAGRRPRHALAPSLLYHDQYDAVSPGAHAIEQSLDKEANEMQQLARQTLDAVSDAMESVQRQLAALKRSRPFGSTPVMLPGRTASAATTRGSKTSVPPLWDEICNALRERSWLPEYGARMPDDPEE